MLKLKLFFRKLTNMSITSTWPTVAPKWEAESLRLLTEDSANQLPSVTLNNIVENSRDFPIKFPVNTMICQYLQKTVDAEILQRNIQSVYPLLHEHSLNLCAKFLIFKRKHGNKIERQFYETISLLDLIERLLRKRAVNFMGAGDSTLLLDNSRHVGVWDIIGTSREKPPLTLENCISYDEIKLSALLSVSSYTYFVNDGNRSNAGFVEQNRSKLEQEGIIIGLIGTRFERENKMEYEEIIIAKQQNTTEKGYGNNSTPSLHKVFSEFYEEPCYTYNDSEVLNGPRFVKLTLNEYFDNIAFKKRISLSFDTLLIEANHRAKMSNKSAYIHVVGIGLGVWKISAHQTQLFVDTFGERIKFFGQNLSNVSDIHFAYISGCNHCLDYKHGDTIPITNHPNGGIKIHISRREPHTKLPEEGKLLVVSYAWDGNAFPGNEFWVGMLTSTGDCAAACSTQISELHNPYINPLVCAKNLHIAMLDGTVKSIKQYIQLRCTNE